MDPSRISQDTLLGKLIRLPFKLIPKRATVRVLRGPARGSRWIAESATRGFWLGYWELDNQRFFASRLRPGFVVYDIGAHVGLYSLLSSAFIGRQGHVYAFEPLPRNLIFLRRHLELNRVTNCTVIEAAVSDCSGRRHFDPTQHDTAGHLSQAGSVLVQTISIDEFLFSDRRIPPPNALKIDAEGAEIDILNGARRTITDFSPLILLSTHSAAAAQQCRAFLQSAGYSVSQLAADTIWAEKPDQ